ncbi:MAG: hypothetical protein NTU47_01000 [Ignavibacteriales bacterium]|nr:hypothetical protein [Ignavibacteriales bacterium]
MNDAIALVFPLFGPIEEKKWADGWDPVALYPASGNLEEGMVFRTPGHEEHENQFFWIVSKYQPANFVVEYVVSTPNRYWVIHIQCAGVSEHETMATITYIYTGLNDLGNEINRQAIENMYKDNLSDWEEAINYYLKTGTTLPQH